MESNEHVAQRKIIHIDMDAFFASVEQRDHAELKGKPIAVGGSEVRGVVAAASYEARKFGVRSAMPGSIAKRLCKDLIFVKHNFPMYREVSRQIREIFSRYSDKIEPLSLDEAFIDVTSNKLGISLATDIAKAIRADILRETHLTASAGISYCKFLAKIASDINKPNGQKLIHPVHAEKFLENLVIDKFFGIGKKTAAKMKLQGIFFGRDLKAKTKAELFSRYGKVGASFFNLVRGIDNRPVRTDWLRKSVSVETTFEHDILRVSHMEEALMKLSKQLYDRSVKNNLEGKTLTLKIRTADWELFTRSKTELDFINQLESIIEKAKELLHRPEPPDRPVRLLGLGFSKLNNEPPLANVQLTLDF